MSVECIVLLDLVKRSAILRMEINNFLSAVDQA